MVIISDFGDLGEMEPLDACRRRGQRPVSTTRRAYTGTRCLTTSTLSALLVPQVMLPESSGRTFGERLRLRAVEV